MSKQKTQYKCNECGELHPKWQGQCAACKQWNTLEEFVAAATVTTSLKNKNTWTGQTSEVIPLKHVKEDSYQRSSSSIQELDRVLGGGLVKGSVVLLAGDPGIGKSTLLLQALAEYSKDKTVLYCSGEESLGQIKMRAERLGVPDADIQMVSEVDLEQIVMHCEGMSPDILVIDSIQTIYTNASNSIAGSTSQLKECAAKITRMAKSKGISVFIIGHVTKDGEIAGPRVLEHIVDTVLYFEGDSGDASRILRSIKNRFGAAQEVGIFAMEDSGLKEVSNPSSMFLTTHEKPVVGSMITATIEGSRPFLVEVQVLVEDAVTVNPKRFASGTDVGRVQLMLAILSKYQQVDSLTKNVYVKVVGGVKVVEPALDLSILIAAYSSLINRPNPLNWCAIGEVGLTGEIRAIHNLEMRIREAEKLGYEHIIVPEKGDIKQNYKIKIHRVKRISEALNLIKNQ